MSLEQTLKMLSQATQNQGRRVQQAQSQPVNRKLINPGQKAGDVFMNPTDNQSRALLEMSLQMLQGNRGESPATSMSRGISKGMSLLDQMREGDRTREVNTAKTGYGIAQNKQDSMIDMAQLLQPEKSSAAPAKVRTYEFFKNLSPEDQAQFLELQRQGQIVDLGGGGIGLRVGDGVKTLVAPEEATGRDAANAGAVEGAKGDANTNTSQVDEGITRAWGNNDAYGLAESMYNTAQEYKTMIANGEISTGPIDSLLYNVLGVGTEELAAMSAEQVEMTLQNLQTTNLAPVTENELREVAKLWASIGRQERPNQGILERAMRKSEALMRSLERDAKAQADRVKRYGSQGQYENLISTNPLLQRLIGSGSRSAQGTSQQGGNIQKIGRFGVEVIE